MGKVENFLTLEDFTHFLAEKKARYQEGFTDYIYEYTTENRIFIVQENRMISFEEIENYCK